MSKTVASRLFGTDGIRARAGDFPLDPPTIEAIGQSIGELLGGEILVARDPRESGWWIYRHLAAGLERGGTRVRNAGILPTPAVALLTQQSSASGGIMISASHNPFEDNGIKVFGARGEKLSDRDEERVEDRVSTLVPKVAPSGLAGSGVPEELLTESLAETREYQRLLLEGFPTGRWLEGIHIAIDCANGATSQVGPALFESLGAQVSRLSCRPDGRNINSACGAVHPESLTQWVRQHTVDLAVAYDGDGDRALFVTGEGRLLDGDAILLIMARAMKALGNLVPPSVVGTSMTNIQLEHDLGREGIVLFRVDVGDRYVFRKMKDEGLPLGGEPSGHIIFPDHGLSGDGLLTTLRLLEVLVREKRTLGELARGWKPRPQLLRNLRVAERVPLEEHAKISGKVQEIKDLLGSTGRIVVRYSGTEPLLRIMIESDSDETNETLARDLTAVIRQTIG